MLGGMDVDSALLRAFVTVAEELHFHRAADRLFLSQQALSKRIARLEALLGVRLLDRGHQTPALTTAGQRLLPEARQAVDAIDAAIDSATARPRMITVDVLDEHLAMLPAVRQVARTKPDLAVSVVMRTNAHPMLTMLRHGTADIALGRPGSLDPGDVAWPGDIRGAQVLAEPIRLLVPAGHSLDQPHGVRPEQLTGQPLWFPTVGAPAEWTGLLAEFVDTFHLSVDRTGSTLGYDYWLAQVAEGIAPASFIGAAMALPAGLPASIVPITSPTPVFLWWAMWRRRIPASLAENFLHPLRGALRTTDFRHPTDPWVPERDRPYLQDTAAEHSTTP